MLTDFIKNIPGAECAIHMSKKIVFSIDSKLNYFYRKFNSAEHDVVKVGFVCQYLPAWSKMKYIYEYMENDIRFEPFVVCLPSDPRNTKYNDTYEIVSESRYKNIINPLNSNGLESIKEYGFDYVFYDRPYNYYLPKGFKSFNASRYSKLCLHPYALSLSRKLYKDLFDFDFVSFVHIFFAETRDSLDLYRAAIMKFTNINKSFYCGYAGIEGILKSKDCDSKSWDFSKNNFRIIWTPRWSVDSFGGGSNFMKYKDLMFLLSREYSNVDFLIRPHPLMFENFLSTGIMLQKEIEDYKTACDNIKNLSLDNEKEYFSTFWKSDLLITDFSTITIEYFLTGKPIIYCESSVTWDCFQFAADLISCCYAVNNEKDLRDTVSALIKGIDPLKAKRERYCKEIFKENRLNPGKSISEQLYDDFLQNKAAAP